MRALLRLENESSLGYSRQPQFGPVPWNGGFGYYLGLLLSSGELLTPGGFYIIFFGIGAVIVGVLAGFNPLALYGFNSSLFRSIGSYPLVVS